MENEANVFVAFVVACICAYYAYNFIPDGSLNLIHLLAGVIGFFSGLFLGLFVLGLVGLAIGLGVIGGFFYLVFFIFIPWLFQSS